MSVSLGIGEEDISSDVEMAEVQIDQGSVRSVESGEKQSSEKPSGGAEKEKGDEIRMESNDLESVKGDDKESEELDDLETTGQVAVVQENEVKLESGGTDQMMVPRDRWFQMVERNELVTDQEAVTSREGVWRLIATSFCYFQLEVANRFQRFATSDSNSQTAFHI